MFEFSKQNFSSVRHFRMKNTLSNRKIPRSLGGTLLDAFRFQSGDFSSKLAHPARFERAAPGLGEANSVRICLPLSALERFILLDF